MNTIAEQILAASDRLSERLAALPPVGDLVALDPTRYCRSAWAAYLQMAARPGCVLVVGMNPGPHGMAQTGVPFTDPHIAAELFPSPLTPAPGMWNERGSVGSWFYHGGHASTPRGRIGLRREQSAQRLWPLLREICAPYAAAGPSADKVAEATRRVCNDVLLVNALPICWLDPAGKNVSAEEVIRRFKVNPEFVGTRLQSEAIHWIDRLVYDLKPAAVLGVGAWANMVVEKATVALPHGPSVLKIKHPSPLAGSEAVWRAEAEPVLRRAVELSRAARGVAGATA